MMWNGDGPWGHGWWWPGFFVMAVFMVFCMVMMVRMMSHGAHGSHTTRSSGSSPDMPERTLANRLASGEIDIEEYERRLAAPRASTGLHPTQKPGRREDDARPERRGFPTGGGEAVEVTYQPSTPSSRKDRRWR